MNKEGGISHKLNGLDHLRAFAIIFVFLYHYGRLFPHPDWVNTISEFGWSGVDLFFVLSGFFVSGILFREYRQNGFVRPGRFLIRRGLKIWPLFYTALFIQLIYLVAKGTY